MSIPDHLSGAPPAILQYLGCCDHAETLVAWWQLEKPRDLHEAMWVVTFNRRSQVFNVSSFPAVVSHWSHQVYGSSYEPIAMAKQLRDGLWGAPAAAKRAVQDFLASLMPSHT